jgi:hypothetical protein
MVAPATPAYICRMNPLMTFRLSASTLTVAAALLIAGMASAAAQQPLRKNQIDFGKRDVGGREIGKRNVDTVERASPCRAHGPRFKAGPGGSCIRIFGGVITEMGTRGNRR